MKKNYMINLFTIIISIVVSSLASVGAISTMYDGTEVSYDNSSTHIAATDVQGAIDQIYATATDYTNLNSRLQILENNFPPFTTSTTHTVEYPYSGNGINLGKFSPTNDIWFDLYANGKIQGSINPIVDGGISVRGWKDGSSLQGTVELKGKKINLDSSTEILAGGADIKNVTAQNLTINTTYTRSSSTSYVKYIKWGKLVIVVLNDVCPKANAAGGTYNIASGLPSAHTEVTTAISTNTSGSSPAYRLRVNGTNLQWNWVSGSSDSCPYAAGEVMYFTS